MPTEHMELEPQKLRKKEPPSETATYGIELSQRKGSLGAEILGHKCVYRHARVAQNEWLEWLALKLLKCRWLQMAFYSDNFN